MRNSIGKMKDSGIAWLGEIPERWEVRRLKYLSNIKRGASPRPIDDPKYFDDNGEFSWVRISDVTASKTYLKKTDQQLSKLGASLSVKQYCGDLFLSIAGTVGKPIIAGIKCCIHDGFVAFSNLSDEVVNKMFLFYILDSGNAYSGLGKEGSQLNLNIDTVANISIPLPPLQTQKLIVDYLDKKTAQIVKFSDDKKKMIELLKEQKQAIIYNAVTKGINKNAKMKDSGIVWLGKIPEGWEAIKLKFLGKIINGSTPLSSEKKYWDGDIDWITPTDLGNSDDPKLYNSGRKITKLGLDSCGSTIVPMNSIIISCRAPIGSIGITTKEMSTNQGCKSFIPNHSLNYEFAYNYFVALNEYLQSLGKGTTFQELSTTEFANSIFLFPPLDEQNQIILYIKEEISYIETAIIKIQKEIELIEEYKKSLIFHAVTGKIDIKTKS